MGNLFCKTRIENIQTRETEDTFPGKKPGDLIWYQNKQYELVKASEDRPLRDDKVIIYGKFEGFSMSNNGFDPVAAGMVWEVTEAGNKPVIHKSYTISNCYGNMSNCETFDCDANNLLKLVEVRRVRFKTYVHERGTMPTLWFDASETVDKHSPNTMFPEYSDQNVITPPTHEVPMPEFMMTMLMAVLVLSVVHRFYTL